MKTLYIWHSGETRVTFKVMTQGEAYAILNIWMPLIEGYEIWDNDECVISVEVS